MRPRLPGFLRVPLPGSIRLRLLIASTLVQVVLLSLLLANSVRLMNEAATASLGTLVTQNAGMLHTMAAAYREQDRFGPLQDVLGELLAEPEGEGLVYVRIFDPRGRLVVSAGMPEMGALPPPDAEDAEGIRVGMNRGLVHVGRDLLMDRNQVGRLQFGVSVSTLAAARQAILEQGGLIAVVEIVLTFLLLSAIGYLLTRNLGRLLEGSRAIAEGRLDHRIPEVGSDELARLASHFNRMAANLQERVGELEQAASHLLASEQRYALAMDGANDGLWDWDIAAGRIYLSPRFCEIAGLELPGGDANPERIVQMLHPDDRAAWRHQLVEHLTGRSPQFLTELRVLLPDGESRWVMTRGLALRDENGWAFRMAGSISDVHQRKLAEAQLVHGALYDSLTGLPNRALFMEHLQSALGQMQRDAGHLFAVLAIDIERFRLVNDSFGHAAGDTLLVRLAAAIRAALRQGDVAARVGGDRFTVLLNGIANAAQALRLAETLREHLARPVTVAGHTLYPQARVGLVFSEERGANAESLLRDADNALNTARQNKDEGVAVFHASMHARALSSLRLEADLRAALREDGFTVHYQPIVSLVDGRVSSLEALARWPHPSLGMVPPAVFIPLAETLDLVHELSMRVLDQVCADVRRWRARGQGTAVPAVGINLSVRQFARPDLAAELIAAIRRNGVDPEWLRLEVTESLLADPQGSAAEVLQALREAGMAVLIDDFGTGYSALSYLHTMPCDVIKLDSSFIRSIGEDARLRAIVRHSIELAHDLGIATVAECIESPTQAVLLRTMDCDYGQGYHYSRPLAAAEVERLLFEEHALLKENR